MKSPCQGCEERNERCHTICEKYIGFTEALKQYRARRVPYAIADGYTADAIQSCIRKVRGKTASRR